MILAVVAITSTLSLVEVDSPPDTTSPTKEYKALLSKWSVESGSFRRATTDEERTAAVERLSAYSEKFSDLAERYPEDPAALTALRQAVQAALSTDSLGMQAWELNRTSFPSLMTDTSARTAVNLLRRDHLQSSALGPVCERMRYGVRHEFEAFLRTALLDSPHRHVRGIACLSLAQFLKNRLEMRNLLTERPKLTERHERLFGPEFVTTLQRIDPEKLAQRIDRLFERATGYKEVKTPFGGTVAEEAEIALYELRSLTVGKVAPETTGLDQHGDAFKLSDYRGKVVLLYFWTEL